MKIQWFPGHIKKARDEINNLIKDVDIIFYIVDSRCPRSCIDDILFDKFKNKKCLIIANKIDLIDKKDYDLLKFTIEKYSDEYIFLDSRSNNINRLIDKKVDNMLIDIINKYDKKGIKNYIIKSIVVGMPNVGKSTFINSYVKKKINNVSDKAGVTKKISLTKLSNHMYMYDTPGVTVPKFDEESIGENLAYIGSINDDIIDKTELCYELLKYLYKYYNIDLSKRYNINIDDYKNFDSYDDIYNHIISDISRNIGAIKKGDNIDIDKSSNIIIDDFRKGKIGKIYLEK